MAHPQTVRILSARELKDLRRTVGIRSETRRQLAADASYASSMPREVSMQLTYKCNLRCTHCFQWNEEGFFQSFDIARQRTELDVQVVADVLEATKPSSAKVFLWGGEPLMHSKFDEIAELLRQTPRIVNMCTNGLLMQRNSDALLGIGEELNLLVSLDGFEAGHEQLRGKGTFGRTMRNVEYMLDQQRQGRFRGEMSVACMVSEDMVGQMYDFTAWAEQAGFNSIYWLFPWYISPDVASAMDDFYASTMSWLNPASATYQPNGAATWHSYTYRLGEEHLAELKRSMDQLASRPWKLRVRYQPQLEADEIDDFVRGTSRPAQGRSRCLAISNRVEVHADGTVSACKFFPEFAIGNLHEDSLADIWTSERFTQVRSTLRDTGLMPVCSKCILLYLNGE